MDWIEREIKEQEKYAREAKAEKEAFAELIDGVEKISIGFDKVAKYCFNPHYFWTNSGSRFLT